MSEFKQEELGYPASIDDQQPKLSLSVIVPTFNAAPFIRATLTSIIRQSVPDVEVIVVDGASTDDTVAIARQSGVPNLYIISEPDRGQLDALQKGVSAATGDIIVWINGDDIVMPQAFKTALDVFKDRADIDFVYADNVAFDEVRRELYYGSTIRSLNDLDHVLFYRQMYSECVYWRKSINRFLPDEYYDLRVYTDYAFFLNLRWGRKGHWIPRRLGAFRVRDGQASAAYGERKKREFRRIRLNHVAKLGFSTTSIALARVFYWPWFALRHKLRPSLQRGVRRVWRMLSGDRRRKREASVFFDEWLHSSDSV